MTQNTEQKYSPTRMLNIKKLTPGSLVLEFQNSIDSSNSRTITIDSNRELYRISLAYAASMFQIQGTYALYKQGYFTFNTEEEKEAVFSYAKELQIYFDDEQSNQGNVEIKYEQPAKLYSSIEFSNMIKLGNIKQITAVLEDGNDAQIELLVDAAVRAGSSIKVGIQNLIEEKTGVGFPEGDE